MEFKYGTPEYEEWIEKSKLAEKECLEEAFKNLDDLYDILNDKLGMNLKFTDTIKTSRGETYIYCKSEDFGNVSGFAKFMFERICIETFNSSVATKKDPKSDSYYGSYDMSKDPECYCWMTIDFSYEHIKGGRNGTEFANCWFENGEWKVRFVDGEEVGKF